MNGHYTTDIIVFDVRDDNATKAYVYVTADAECPYFMQGWHCAEFPPSITTEEIFQSMFHGDTAHGYILWAAATPELPE